ncbi:hypothetical protein FVEG_11426 [Fusarium verticillioides 7600]|uniref:Uncharacterized protein n=1 Tax=Gibberella moniliformis (strain M3125 / FGSC 7600) TaxID=334819 RepID=W7MMU8_GIBM7|nr:hypothetical protein FVEG_11426 [Fusarium verticillioides 7600]EWG52808.1 hypothetical protein FVEG_11426 [Fusarium verticillioides 7600]
MFCIEFASRPNTELSHLDFTGIPLDCYDMSNLFIEDIKMGMIFEHRRSSYICGGDMDISLADNMKAFGIYHHD